ncbi:hypothetical protein CCAX7_54930 [Capsulimonas corticalis]|uniref:Uncharacterized protein n=1 Tax=Capsulimonas corticalis TaxID=2219043 RepID=A0A402D5X0_9BACT|nr:hypothetical protein [Capsulimonas corticalis]BDI33442.1 hypothetical protein CCAX7_54930 [Capsulimonas corticalis]
MALRTQSEIDLAEARKKIESLNAEITSLQMQILDAADEDEDDPDAVRGGVDHVRLSENFTLMCDHCGDSYRVNSPVEISIMVATMRAYGKLHRSCPANRKEPRRDH